MFKEIIKTIKWGNHDLHLETGKIARQADGAVMVRSGGSAVLCTAVSAREPKDGVNFFPLTVHYREMSFAAGKIPGGFLKREGQASMREVLVSRLIDRPIRPLFDSSFFNETQVICTVLSYDPKCCTDILAIIGASAALALSGVPYKEIVAASKVGLIDGEFVLNPSFEMLKQSKLDLVVAGTKSSVMMVESEAHLLTEEQMLEAVKFGHSAFQPVLEMIDELVAEAGKTKWAVTPIFSSELKEQIRQKEEAMIRSAFAIASKQERVFALNQIHAGVVEHFTSGEQFTPLQVELALEEVKSDILREDLLKSNIRIDGRKLDQIRPIASEISLLPYAHGSALFTRGETQAVVVTTLGTGQDEQIVDSLDGEYKDRFMLNYIFPPYSVGETTPLKAPGRREMGHGKLAWRALNPVLPSKEEFPYSFRIVSEITESNGSSSMATVCGGSMSLMDAGVPIKEPVSGIAMGLIKEGNDFVVLSDILGDEDHLGDMDFKVAGSKNGVTALQMDIKVTGITFEIMEQALSQAKAGRMHILSEMNKSISSSTGKISKHAPSMVTFKIDKDKIREIIGPGGKVIREICESTGSKIDISDDGNVSVSAVGEDKLNLAISRIKAIAMDPEIGDIFDGTVVKILESGAFVNYLPGKDGFVHISEISDDRIPSVAQVLKIGDVVKIKFLGIDKGKARFTARLGAGYPKIEVHAAAGDNGSDSEREAGGYTVKSPARENSSSRRAISGGERREPRKRYDNDAGDRDGGSGASGNEGAQVKTERKYFN